MLGIGFLLLPRLMMMLNSPANVRLILSRVCWSSHSDLPGRSKMIVALGAMHILTSR
jgi:hypothetical protein